MKRVFQTKFGKPEGNCLGACVISILELEVKDIPSLGMDNWWGELKRFVRPFGYESLYFCPDNREEFFNQIAEVSPEALYVGGNDGPRGLKHCVVLKGKTMIHDPHPDGGGIEMPPEDYIYFVKGDLLPRKAGTR